MLEILKAIIFGIIEGITEWLPISSTGHLILLNEIMPLNVTKEFWDMFLVVIQLGAILAVVVLFWNEIWPFQLHPKNTGSQDKNLSLGPIQIKQNVIMTWLKIIITCIPAITFVLLDLDDLSDKLFYNPVGVSIALIVFGIAFIVIENSNKKKVPVVQSMENITWKMALIIGMFQLLAAIFPGTSRSGATILGALLIGVSRTAASKFTFILAIPVMFGASLLEILDFGLSFKSHDLVLLLAGLITSFGVSIIVIKYLLNYIRKHNFKIFGWYRIVLGAVVLIYFYLFR